MASIKNLFASNFYPCLTLLLYKISSHLGLSFSQGVDSLKHLTRVSATSKCIVIRLNLIRMVGNLYSASPKFPDINTFVPSP